MELFLIAIAYLFGIIIGLYFKIGIAFIVVFCTILYLLRNKNRYIKLFCSKKYIILFLIFFIISYIQINHLEKQFNEKYKNIQGQIQVIGTIVSNPIEKENSRVYTLKVEKIDNNKSYKNTKLRLYIKKDLKIYKYGDEIQLSGEFEEPEVQRNTGGFDYKEYLKIKNIYGIIRANETKLIKENNESFINILVNKIANKIKQKANTLLSKDEASILIGILIGDKENLEEETQEAFRKSNLSHMLAVSGAHVSYVIMAIGFIISKTKISKNSGKIITISLLLFFMLLTGQTPSVTRACIMSIYMIAASLFHKRVTTLSSMSISIIILLFLNPYCIFDIGLQLSYGGTIGILLLMGTDIIRAMVELMKTIKIGGKNKQKSTTPYLKNFNQKIKEIVLVSLSANIIIIPIMLYHFNTLSLTFLFSNLLASPLLGFIIILGFISIIISFVFLPLAKIICIPLKISLKIFYKIATGVGNLPFSQVYVPTPKIFAIIIYYLIITIIILYQKIKNKPQKRKIEKIILKKLKKITFKKLISVILIFLVIVLLNKQIPKNLNIYFIDVGQGDSTLIVTPQGKTILIDGGGSRDNKSYDVGKNTLIPYILNRGIAKLDYIIVSHFDSDHATGCAYIMENLKVFNIILTKQLEENDLYKQIVNIAIKRNINLIYVKAGDRLEIDGVTMRVLHPTKELIEENSTNNNSVVCRLEYNSFSMLFTGDIEEIAEEKILNNYKNNLSVLKSTVLKVGHHGSKTSSTDDFIKAVRPTIALIGVGKNNKFGHPNDGVLQRLKENKSRIYRTDENGEISITVNKKGKITKIQKCINSGTQNKED